MTSRCWHWNCVDRLRAPRPLLWLVLAMTALVARPAGAGWVLAHEEDFSVRTAPDAGFWRAEEGFHRNQEDQYYAAGNVSVRNGALVIEARQERVANAQWRDGSRDWRFRRRTARFTSGALVSRAPLQFGRIEVVARASSSAGTWPAVWLLHESASSYGEIDLYEAVGKHPDTVFSGVHWGRSARGRQHRNQSLLLPGFDAGWHTHTLEWTPDAIRIAVDGRTYFSFDPAEAATPGLDPLRQPMFLHLNLALGGTWGGPIDTARLPARLEVASIRIWRWDGATAGAVPAADAAPAGPDLQPRWGR
jgi:beta-glucanase (GH16 family)